MRWFVENETSQSEVARMPPRGPAGRGNRQNDDAQREHRKAHEFENQRVHNQSPQANRQIGGEAIDCLLIFGVRVRSGSRNVRATVNDLRPAKGLKNALPRFGRIRVG
jgi:hypothetical protein